MLRSLRHRGRFCKYNPATRIFAAVVCSLVFVTATHAQFPDTGDSWYRDSIHKLQARGIVRGKADGKFYPLEKVTRAEMLKIAMEAAKIYPQPDTSYQCFPDVAASAWYTPYICTAKQQGIATGHIDGLFRPDGSVTVHEAIAFLARTFEIDVENPQSGHWYEPYESFASENEIIDTSRYNVTQHVLRGQVAEITDHFLQYAEGEEITYNSFGCSRTAKSGLSPLDVWGKSREFLQFVPSSYDNKSPHSLIIAFHGRTNSNEMVQDYMGLEGRRQWRNNSWQQNSQNDAIVVYPAGLPNGGGYSWDQAENVDFFDKLIRTMADNYCIDRRNIFVVGHSLGGYFANKVACLRGDVIRGKGVVGSSPYSSDCTGPVASLIFHHPNDRLVVASSGDTVQRNVIERNFCQWQTNLTAVRNYTCQQNIDCREGNPVTFCSSFETYGGDPHSWPKDAGNSFLEFFQKLSIS